MIDNKLQSYYENRFSMMASDGWKDLIEDAEQMFKALNNVMPIQNETELHLKRGQLDILQWLLNLKDSSAQTYEQLVDDSAGAAQGDSSGD
jgi:hypothetical protein